MTSTLRIQRELKKCKSAFGAGRILRESGYYEIGAGAFASAYMSLSEPTTVIKVVNEGDEAYDAFIRMTHRTPSRHFPKVINVMDVGRGGKIYFLEKLIPIQYGTIDMDRMTIGEVAWLYNMGFVEVYETLFEFDLLSRLSYSSKEFAELLEKIKSEWHVPRVLEKHVGNLMKGYEEKSRESLPVALRRIQRLTENHYCSLDLHGGNILYRESDASIVFSDPVA